MLYHRQLHRFHHFRDRSFEKLRVAISALLTKKKSPVCVESMILPLNARALLVAVLIQHCMCQKLFSLLLHAISIPSHCKT